MFSFINVYIFPFQSFFFKWRQIITTHEECHEGNTNNVVRNYCIKMSVHCSLRTQTIRVQTHPGFGWGARESVFGKAEHWSILNLGSPK